MRTRAELLAFLNSGSFESVRALLLDALFSKARPPIVGVEGERFATELNVAYDRLNSPGSRLCVQDACAAVLSAVPWRHADIHSDGITELLAIAKHTSSLATSRCMFEFAQKSIGKQEFAQAWKDLGDLIVTVVIEAIEYPDVLSYARKLFFDERFEPYAFIVFFRIAEVSPSSSTDLFPRFFELLGRLSKREPSDVPFVQKRFVHTFDQQQIARLLDSLEPDQATDVAEKILHDTMTVEIVSREPDLAEEPVPTTAYFISRRGEASKPVEVNPVPFVRAELRRARRDPTYFSERLRDLGRPTVH